MQAGGGYQRSQNWSKALEAAKKSRNERFGPNQDWTKFLTQYRARISTRFSTRFFRLILDSILSSNNYPTKSLRLFQIRKKQFKR